MTKKSFFARINRITLCAILLISLVVTPAVSPIQQVQQTILRVPQDFPSIQAAADAAPEGATIQIAPGTYTENITIAKNLALQGSSTGVTILQPVPGFRDAQDKNPLITVQSPQGDEILLRLRQLSVRSPQPYDQTVGLNIESPKNVSLTLEHTSWDGWMSPLILASSLRRLEVRDSLFRQIGYLFANGEGLRVEEALVEGSRFLENWRDTLFLGGKHLRASNNTVIGERGFCRSGIIFLVEEGGRAELVGNSVSLCGVGITVGQSGRKASLLVQKNWLFANSYNVFIDYGLALPEVLARLDLRIEDNLIIGGGVGVNMRLSRTEGGTVSLRRNQIVWQRRESLTDDFYHWSSGVRWSRSPFYGNAILLSWSLRREELQVPVKMEISENRIESNESWGVAIKLEPGLNLCNSLKAEGEEKIFTDPEIIGTGNEFRNNLKGDLCPADYPWPPGFRK
jgi:nitrous oxidase accessory protein NosD